MAGKYINQPNDYLLICIGMVLFGIGFFYIFGLTSIPRAMATNMPAGLQCDFYGSWWQHMGCTRGGDVFSNPWPSLIGLGISIFLLTIFYVFVQNKALIITLLALQTGFAAAVSVFVRAVSYVLGYATGEYLLWTLAPLLVAIVSAMAIWICLQYAPYGRYSPREHARRQLLNESINREIAERQEEKNDTW